jgi:predicted membrane channel-forming protein YqfA (hemolysin III family)
MTTDDSTLTDDGKLLFGAGFVFGVMVTLVLLGVVVAVIAVNGQSVPSTVVTTVVAGVVFASIVGGGLYLLAFPENRTRIPVEADDFGLGGGEEER